MVTVKASVYLNISTTSAMICAPSVGFRVLRENDQHFPLALANRAPSCNPGSSGSCSVNKHGSSKNEASNERYMTSICVGGEFFGQMQNCSHVGWMHRPRTHRTA